MVAASPESSRCDTWLESQNSQQQLIHLSYEQPAAPEPAVLTEPPVPLKLPVLSEPPVPPEPRTVWAFEGVTKVNDTSPVNVIKRVAHDNNACPATENNDTSHT